jgi:hypothetical protein
LSRAVRSLLEKPDGPVWPLPPAPDPSLAPPPPLPSLAEPSPLAVGPVLPPRKGLLPNPNGGPPLPPVPVKGLPPDPEPDGWPPLSPALPCKAL